jgi:hypothetical protein
MFALCSTNRCDNQESRTNIKVAIVQDLVVTPGAISQSHGPAAVPWLKTPATWEFGSATAKVRSE